MTGEDGVYATVLGVDESDEACGACAGPLCLLVLRLDGNPPDGYAVGAIVTTKTCVDTDCAAYDIKVLNPRLDG
jgi:hypothetical protein